MLLDQRPAGPAPAPGETCAPDHEPAHARPARLDRLRTAVHRRAAELHTAVRSGRDDGMATAEYAIVTVAAVGFAGLLVVILRSPEVRGALMSIIEGALSR